MWLARICVGGALAVTLLWADVAAAQGSCAAARSHVGRIRPEIGAQLPREARAPVDGEAMRRAPGEAAIARVYGEFAAGAFMAGDFVFAAWAAVEAASRNWSADAVADVGSALAYIGETEKAVDALRCAREMDPRQPYAAEALAVLAHKQGDCRMALTLIEEAVALAPDDIDLLYAQAVIAHKCGQGDLAKTAIRLAAAFATGAQSSGANILAGWVVLSVHPDPITPMRPPPRFIDEAQKAIDPPGRSGTPAMLHCFDKLDYLGEKAMQGAALVDRLMQVAGNPRGTYTAEHVLDRVARFKENFLLELGTVWMVDGRFDPERWNGLLYRCANEYYALVGEYERLVSPVAHQILLASALHSTPDVIMRQLVRGQGDGYLYLDAGRIFEERMPPVYAARATRDEACTVADIGLLATRACHEESRQAFCAAALPIWHDYTQTVLSTANILHGQLPHAVREYTEYWGAIGRDARDFASYSVSLMQPVPDYRANVPKEVLATLPPDAQAAMAGALSGPEYFAGVLGQEFDVSVGGMFMLVETSLRAFDDSLRMDMDVAPVRLDRGIVEECRQRPKLPETLAEEIDVAIATMREMSTAEITEPECEMVIGNWGTSFNPLSWQDTLRSAKYAREGFSGEVKHVATNDGVPGNDRWGVSAKYGKTMVVPVAGPPNPLFRAGPAFKTGVGFYAEGGGNGGPVNYGFKGDVKAGAGVEAGLGDLKSRAACYVGKGELNLNMRVLMSRLL